MNNKFSEVGIRAGPKSWSIPMPGGIATWGWETTQLSDGSSVPTVSLTDSRLIFGWTVCMPRWDAFSSGRKIASTCNPFKAWYWSKKLRFAKFAAALSEDGDRLRRLAMFSEAVQSKTSSAYITTRDLELATAVWCAAKKHGRAAMKMVTSLVAAPSRLPCPCEEIRANANGGFLAGELKAWAEFLDKVEKNRLTKEQRRVVLENDHRVQVVAAAGSGKTATAVAKVGYLIASGFAKPEEILVLAFNKKAVEEISGRIRKRLHVETDVRTFHKLGLDLVGEITGKKPRLHRAVEQDRIKEFIAEILIHLAESGSWSDVERTLAVAQVEMSDLKERLDVISKSPSGNPAAVHVRSPQEEALCGLFDYLKRTGTLEDWEYEPDYRQDTRDSRHSQYRPDFAIRFKNIPETFYWEHFALNEDGTSTFGPEYTSGVEWKRALHRQHKTTLLESQSWWWGAESSIWVKYALTVIQTTGVTVPKFDKTATAITESLRLVAEQRPRHRQEKDGRSWDETRTAALDPTDSATQEKNIKRFLDIVTQCLSLMRERGLGAVPRPVPGYVEELARTIDRVAAAYATEMDPESGATDYPAMVAEATRLVPYAPSVMFPWKAIIIDEFQDVSPGRMALARAILEKNPDARLTCVGDDWQSIYRFTGADVGIMTGLSDHLGHPVRRIDMTETFRCPQKVADVASTFVQKNPGQMRKTVKGSHDGLARPIVILSTNEVIGHSQNSPIDTALAAISTRCPIAKTIFVLTRYNYQIPDKAGQKEIMERHPRLMLEWSTVHSAKGREADAVIVAGLFDGLKGFPAKMEEHPVLSTLLTKVDTVPYAEERRLFYVALTRAKNMCVLLCPTTHPSTFVNEIAADSPDLVEIVADGILGCKPCQKCSRGHMVAADGGYGRFFRCNNYPSCDNKENACPKCRMGMLMQEATVVKCSSTKCSYVAKQCPKCRRGFLKLRRRSSDNKPFLGCDRYYDLSDRCTYTRDASPDDLTLS